jgi:hypothetical protein
MAGEWISVDCCLPSKPEALMIMAATGQPPDVVVGRLTIFWGWVQLNAVDGVINGTPDVLALVAGGDAAFWLAVEKAGWLTFSDDGKVRISGWEERFSQAAKERLKDKRRKADGRKADKLRTQSGQLPDKNQTTDGLEEKRREKKRNYYVAVVKRRNYQGDRRRRRRPSDSGSKATAGRLGHKCVAGVPRRAVEGRWQASGCP